MNNSKYKTIQELDGGKWFFVKGQEDLDSKNLYIRLDNKEHANNEVAAVCLDSGQYCVFDQDTYVWPVTPVISSLQ